MPKKKKTASKKKVDSLVHEEAKRTNIPTPVHPSPRFTLARRQPVT
ncbi:MAG: hypothetical protein ACLFUF_07590 [Opitutales bacterium]